MHEPDDVRCEHSYMASRTRFTHSIMATQHVPAIILVGSLCTPDRTGRVHLYQNIGLIHMCKTLGQPVAGAENVEIDHGHMVSYADVDVVYARTAPKQWRRHVYMVEVVAADDVKTAPPSRTIYKPYVPLLVVYRKGATALCGSVEEGVFHLDTASREQVAQLLAKLCQHAIRENATVVERVADHLPVVGVPEVVADFWTPWQ